VIRTGIRAVFRAVLQSAAAAVLLLLVAAVCPPASARGDDGRSAVVAAAELPPDARETLVLIRQGGPFPYDRDGVVFGNFERRLPARERGYYREYTVPTPGLKHRGVRRIVAGRAGELYYSDDHYRTFKRIRE
jgi:ribonuclease T1